MADQRLKRPYGKLRSCRATASAAAVALGLAACDTVPQESLRIATFNAALLSPAFRCINATAPDCLVQSDEISELWAEDLATRILANRDELDVIALNEVWDEDARKILVNRLSDAYPVQVRKVNKGLVGLDFSSAAPWIQPRLFGEDSGLMLFAKREFDILPLPDPSFKWTGDSDTNVFDALDSSSPEVAFHHYRNCSSEDCLASKGVALVRLRHRRGGITYNIAFTHMQADSSGVPEEYANTSRAKQFDEIRQFLLRGFPDMAVRMSGTETFLLLGDLNVPFLKADNEWKKQFATPPNFFSDSLLETWMSSSSPQDRTPTNSIEPERLDHVLIGAGPPLGAPTTGPNTPESRHSCVQHLTVPPTFVRHASDHSMVQADINFGGVHCRPDLALPVDTQNASDIVQSPSGLGDTIRLNNPGAIQWFLVPDRDIGTYSIGTDRPGQLDVRVYLPSNMSEPVARYNVTDGKGLAPRGARGGQFTTNTWSVQGPFFIRVSGKTRFAKTDYNLAVRKHRCESKATACVLQPGFAHSATLSSATDLNPQYEAWFRFDVTGKPTSGGLQQIDLEASLPDGPVLSAGLESYADPTGAPPLAPSITPTLRRWQGGAGTGTSGYIRIHQNGAGPVPRQVSAKLDTSLRFLNVFDLVCEDETNPEFGSDEISSVVTIDGVQSFAPAGPDVEFDCDEPRDVHDWGAAINMGTIAYTNNVLIRLYEKDSPTAHDMLGSRELLSPDPGQAVRTAPPAEWKAEGGHYLLFYETRRRENAPVADP